LNVQTKNHLCYSIGRSILATCVTPVFLMNGSKEAPGHVRSRQLPDIKLSSQSRRGWSPARLTWMCNWYETVRNYDTRSLILQCGTREKMDWKGHFPFDKDNILPCGCPLEGPKGETSGAANVRCPERCTYKSRICRSWLEPRFDDVRKGRSVCPVAGEPSASVIMKIRCDGSSDFW
jgi:hypothetical protein